MNDILMSILRVLRIPNLVRSLIAVIASLVIVIMPSFFFTDTQNASRYMLEGDSVFRYDAGDRWTVGFASAVLTPDDADSGRYFIAGYYSNVKAQGVMDDMFARAVYLDDNTGRGGVIHCAVDCIGLSRNDVNAIRKLVIESGSVPNLKSINIAATHAHSAIDTQGLWGEEFYRTGRDKEYMRLLHKRTADAIIMAYRSRKNGTLHIGSVETQGMQEDLRTPIDYSKDLTRLRFAPTDGSAQTMIINYACHAELLGKNNRNISADFPAYMGREIALMTGGVQNPDGTVTGGANFAFFNGAIGGMISSKNIMDVYDNPDFDTVAFTKEFGRELGTLAMSIEQEIQLEPIINTRSRQIKIPGDNVALIVARFLGVLNNDITRDGSKASIFSEVAYVELGRQDVGMFLVPGELYPELETGNFLPAEAAGMGFDAQYTVLSEINRCKRSFVIGLANDELGYIIPDNDFVLHEWLPYFNIPRDRFDREHYEEINSTGVGTARIILEAFESMLSE